MTVETEQSSIVFTGIVDGVALNVPFPVQATTELKVRYGALDTLATLGVHYTVALVAPDYLTATVTPMTGFAVISGGTISVRREVPYTQPTDIPTLVTLASSRIEQMFDRIVFIAQQLRDALVYSLKFPTTDQAVNIGSLPIASERASKYLGFDVNGKPIAVASATGTTVMTAFGTAWVQLLDALAGRTYLGVYSTAQVDTIGDAKIPKSLLTTIGDVIYASAVSTASRLGIGSAYQFLGVSGGIPAWRTPVLPTMHIYGLTWTNNAGDATNDLDFAVGGGMDDTGVDWIQVAATTKQSDAVWAADNGATPTGGLDLIGSAGNNDFEVYAIKNPTTSATGTLFVLAGTAPTMPAGYTLKRKVNWFKRAAGTIVAAKQHETAGGGLDFVWTVPTLDVSLANTLTTAGRADPLRLPLTFSTVAKMNALINDATAPGLVWVYNPDHTSAAPSDTVAPLANMALVAGAGVYFQGELRIRTSATGTIGARANIATVDTYQISTLSFEWSRR